MVQVQYFGTGTRYKLEILHQSVKSVKIKSQKVSGANSYVCRIYRGKTGWGAFLALPPPPPPILNRVKENHRLIAVDLSKQTKLKDPQQNNFIGKLENQAHGAKMFFITEKSEDTTF